MFDCIWSVLMLEFLLLSLYLCMCVFVAVNKPESALHTEEYRICEESWEGHTI